MKIEPTPSWSCFLGRRQASKQANATQNCAEVIIRWEHRVPNMSQEGLGAPGGGGTLDPIGRPEGFVRVP